MTTFTVDLPRSRSIFLAQLDRFVETVGRLDDRELLTASRCHGWSRLDLVVHARVGLQEMLGGAAATTDAPADTDAASYWATYEPDGDGDDVDDILWTRRTASAYRRPTQAHEHLSMVAAGLHAAVAAMPDGPVSFQGHVLTSGDFLATWAVELAVHHLDLGDGVGPADHAALRLARETVEHLLGATVSAEVHDEDVVLVGTGRLPASAEHLAACPAFHSAPVLG